MPTKFKSETEPVNITELHSYLGRLLEAGIDPNLPVVSLVKSLPQEIDDLIGVEGDFEGDPSPQIMPSRQMKGRMLALIPVREYPSSLLNPRFGTGEITHTTFNLPVKLKRR